MNDTGERILLAALKLFSADGFEAVSVSDIAREVGITKGALYRHYPSKRDIFLSIVGRMEESDSVLAGNFGLLAENNAASFPERFRDYAEAMFAYWTEDEFASRFRKTLTVEQYRNPEMRELFERYLSVGPFEYTRDEFEKAGVRNPEKRAAELYSAMFFGYSLVDSGVVFSFGDFADGFFAGEDFK